MDDVKLCSGPCGKTKPLADFYKKGNGFRSECKECGKAAARAWAKENPEKNRIRTAKWAKEHPKEISDRNKKRYRENPEATRARSLKHYYENIEQIRAKNKKYREDNPDKIKLGKRDWYIKNAENIKEGLREKYAENPEKFKQVVKLRRESNPKREKEDQKRRYEKNKNNPEYRIPRLLRKRLNTALNGKSKKASAVQDLGCSIEEFVKRIESLFTPSPTTGEFMSWANHRIDGWHLDHIIPLSYFDLEDETQVKIACHYMNIQPLWAEDNMRKGDKVPENVDDVITNITRAMEENKPMSGRGQK